MLLTHGRTARPTNSNVADSVSAPLKPIRLPTETADNPIAKNASPGIAVIKPPKAEEAPRSDRS